MKQNIIKITKCLNTHSNQCQKQENHSKASIKQTKFDSEFRVLLWLVYANMTAMYATTKHYHLKVFFFKKNKLLFSKDALHYF